MATRTLAVCNKIIKRKSTSLKVFISSSSGRVMMCFVGRRNCSWKLWSWKLTICYALCCIEIEAELMSCEWWAEHTLTSPLFISTFNLWPYPPSSDSNRIQDYYYFLHFWHCNMTFMLFSYFRFPFKIVEIFSYFIILNCTLNIDFMNYLKPRLSPVYLFTQQKTWHKTASLSKEW